MENLPSTIQSLEERFHALFLGNVAASILTTPEGLIVDCNDAFARMFGFDSRTEVLAKTAWDFYFDRAEREAFISPLRVVENYSGEQLVLRHKSGASMYVIGTRMVASRKNNRPELVLGTSIDITEQKRLERRVQELSKSILRLPDQTPNGEAQSIPAEPVELVEVFEELESLLHRVNRSLRPDRSGILGRSDTQEFIVAVERMKVLVQQLEILRLADEPKKGT